jgi:glutamate formiminotransferase
MARALRPELFESVPNFSEGKDQLVIAEIGAAIARSSAHLLDLDPDPDHNRLVLSLAAASAEALRTALLAAVTAAIERIDIRDHVGVHPRLGSADVIPIVPLGATSLARCVEVAHHLGELVWDLLRVPVHFYGAAALEGRPVTLARIRAGGLPPDLGGDGALDGAGSVCIGARPPLVAYNVMLPGAGAEQAAALASRIRELSGGAPGVQALAFQLSAGWQLSMNLYRLELSPPAAVLARVEELADEIGLTLGPDQVVGLCPAFAATGCQAAAGRLLEGRLAAAAARAGAARVARRRTEEFRRLAARLESEAVGLGEIGSGPEDMLAGAERAAALIRVLEAARSLEAGPRALLDAAARGFRAAVDAATARRFRARVAALDARL